MPAALADTTRPVTPPAPPDFGWRTVSWVYAVTLGFGVLIAALLSHWDTGHFWRNLVFSEAIGLWAASLSMGLRWVPGIRQLPSSRAFIVCLIAAIPLAYVFGHATAQLLLGLPVTFWHIDGIGGTALMTTAGATVVVTYLVWIRQRLAEEATARAQAQQLALEAELRMLRAQLEPHMLFNTLANLRSLVEEDPREAQRMLDLLIVYLRSALAGSRSEQTTLKAEFDQLRAYLEIMSLRLGPRLQYHLELPAALQAQVVPPMLLQPLVENAIRHGIEPRVGGGMIRIEARRGTQGLEIRVHDDGAGLETQAFVPDAAEAASPPPTGGFGLQHVRERLRALYGPAAGLSLTAAPAGGTEALVRIPA